MDLLYRDELTIPKNIDFGFEIEIENIDEEIVKDELKSFLDADFKIQKEISLKDGGFELITPPLYNKVECWKKLKDLTEKLKKYNPTFDHASFQVNLGIENYSPKDLIEFLKFYASYEEIIIRLSRGKNSNLRSTYEKYAKPIGEKLYKCTRYYNPETILSIMTDKQDSITFKRSSCKYPKDLIEFRSPNGTIDIELWQNYITIFYYMLRHIKTDKYDKELINHYFDKFFIKRDIKSILDYPNIRKAEELAEYIFEDEIDKKMLIKQYEYDPKRSFK